MVCNGIAGGVSGADGGKSFPERIKNGANEFVKATEENYEELANMLANSPGVKGMKATSKKSTEELVLGGGPAMVTIQESLKEIEKTGPLIIMKEQGKSIYKILTNNPIIEGIKGFFK